MKKISRLAASFVLLASFGVPFLASAQSCSIDNPTCPTGFTCRMVTTGNGSTGTCVSLSSGSGTGVPNLNVITPYSAAIINFINGILVPILMAVAFIVFLWGVYNYFILGAADEGKRTEGRQFVLWGIIGFVVILSVWALVTIVGQTLGLKLGGAAPFKPPTL